MNRSTSFVNHPLFFLLPNSWHHTSIILTSIIFLTLICYFPSSSIFTFGLSFDFEHAHSLATKQCWSITISPNLFCPLTQMAWAPVYHEGLVPAWSNFHSSSLTAKSLHAKFTVNFASDEMKKNTSYPPPSQWNPAFRTKSTYPENMSWFGKFCKAIQWWP